MEFPESNDTISYTKEIKDLITQLLDKDPSKRLDVEKIKDHQWFKDISWDDIIQQKETPEVKPEL